MITVLLACISSDFHHFCSVNPYRNVRIKGHSMSDGKKYHVGKIGAFGAANSLTTQLILNCPLFFIKIDEDLIEF